MFCSIFKVTKKTVFINKILESNIVILDRYSPNGKELISSYEINVADIPNVIDLLQTQLK